jgi:hypothetical protein
MKVATMGFVVLASAATYAGFAAVAWPDAMKAYEIKEIAMGSEVTIWPTRFLLPVGLIVAAAACLLLFVRLLTSADARRLLTSEHVEDPDVAVH